MELSTQDIVKKAILDSQERVRDYMSYSDKVDDKRLKAYFREYAEIEGRQAQRLKEFIES